MQVTTATMSAGLSAEQALHFRKDASRLKYEAATSHALALDNVSCFITSGDTTSKRGQQILTHGKYSRKVLLSFMPLTRAFNHLAVARSMRATERDILLRQRRCRWHDHGVGIPLPIGTPGDDDGGFSTRDALDTFHARLLLASLGHAVAAHEALTRRLSSQGGEAPVMVPLLFKPARDEYTLEPSSHSSLGATLGTSDAFLSAARALTTKPDGAIAADVATIFAERCACFRRFDASGAPFSMIASRPRSMARWWRVRRALLANIRRLPGHLAFTPPSATSVPFVLIGRAPASWPHASMPTHSTVPTTKFMLANEPEVIESLERRLGVRVHATRLDATNLTHAQRVELLSTASGLITLGGAWLAHMAFLPSQERATAIVEVYAATGTLQPRSAHATARFSLQRHPDDPFVRLATALRVERYSRVAARVLPHNARSAAAGSSEGGIPQIVTGAPLVSAVASEDAILAGLQPLATRAHPTAQTVQAQSPQDASVPRATGEEEGDAPPKRYARRWPVGLVRAIDSQLAAEYTTTISERNICIAYAPSRARIHAGPHDSPWAQQLQLISLNHVAGASEGRRKVGGSGRGTEHTDRSGASSALSVLLGFSEYTLTYFELLVTRAAWSTAEIADLTSRCTRKPLGFGVSFSFNNVYHAIFHALPAAERLAELRALSSAAGGGAAAGLTAADVDAQATFVPILHPRMALRGESEARRWHAWDFAVRALTSRAADEIVAQTEALLGSCTCFDRLEGSAEAFNFNAVESQARLRAFRTALLVHVGRMPRAPSAALALAAGPLQAPPRERLLLYVHRRSQVRSLSNEAELHASLRTTVPQTRRIELDSMPLAEQMRAVASATTLVAVFGQALTWMILLAPNQGGGVGGSAGALRGGSAAVVELSPREAFWKRDYEILSHVLGLRFTRLYGNLSSCMPQPPVRGRWQQRLAEFNRWLTCNLTIDVAKVVRVARKMEDGCVTKCF